MENCHQATTVAGDKVENKVFLMCPPTCSGIKPRIINHSLYKCKRIFICLNKWREQRYYKTFGKPPPQSMFQTTELENKVKRSKELLCEESCMVFFHCTKGLSKDQH